VSLWPPRLTGLRRLLQATVLRVELERTGVDHLHAHFATSAAGLASLARRMGGPSYSVTAHAKDIYHSDVRVERLREKLVAATFVATVSRRNRDYIASVLGEQERVRVVSNSVDLGRLGRPQANGRGEAVVLAVARLIEKKGLADLVDACGLLTARGVALRLELAGTGPLRAPLAEAAARHGVPVVFHGALPHEQVRELYRRATVFSLPCVIAANGDRDGLPTSVLEAMASGVPVVTTAVNGLEEAVLHERTGLVVPERDPAALAAALERVLSDPQLAARLARGGREHVEQSFSLERSVTLLRSLFPEPA
jgi:colanic acid/amylovoran biosynthesis glycosyltransferase